MEAKKVSIFDKAPEIKVSMTGKEYIAYRKSRRFKLPKFSKKTKKALPYFMFAFAGIVIISFLIQHLTYVPPPIGFVSNWSKLMPSLVKASWSTIGKVTAIFFAPFLVIMIGLAWLIHGFGFLIFKG